MKESSDALGSIGAEAFKKAPFLNSSLILRISETCLITTTDRRSKENQENEAILFQNKEEMKSKTKFEKASIHDALNNA